ncbi:unnamed protein product [Rhizophagus irregularis]|nr:unnamed protein product [Rhizophagus irregularis]
MQCQWGRCKNRLIQDMSSKNSRYLSTYKTATKFIIQMKDKVESQYKQYQKINHICYTSRSDVIFAYYY